MDLLKDALSDPPRLAAATVCVVALLVGALSNGFMLGLCCTLGAAMLTAHVFTLQQTVYALVYASRDEHYVLHEQLSQLNHQLVDIFAQLKQKDDQEISNEQQQ